ncbi:hypothetical protein GQ53DRAFT_846455 [Thozetella sp. PMI_491]|nr:hypothetical protein GQ53DRAFT_846455 [Thozetella sp. PMI_491]
MIDCSQDRYLPSAPRSRGCINCVARKTRCDGGQPTCRACEGRKQLCHGYRRKGLVFLNEGWRAPGVGSPNPPKTTSPAVHRARQGHRDPQARSSLERSHNGDGLALPRPIAMDPVEIYVSFFMAQFARDLPQEGQFFYQSCSRCFKLLLNKSASRTDPLEPYVAPMIVASEALVTGHFAKLNRSRGLLQESAHMYTTALTTLSVVLDEARLIGISSLREDDWLNLVVSCLMLTFWELAMNPDSTNWQNHVRGLASLIEGRGPAGMRTPAALQLAFSSRMLILLETISSKRPSFLAKKTWRDFRAFCAQPQLDSTLHPAIKRSEAELVTAIAGPRHILDFAVDHLITTSTLIAAFDEIRRNGYQPNHPLVGLDKVDNIQRTGLEILDRMETTLASVQRMSEAGSSRPPTQSGFAQDALSEKADNAVTKIGPSSREFLVYNLTSLCRTSVMSLRLLMLDVIDIKGERDFGSAYEHRAALISHVEDVLNSIPHSSQESVFGVAPVCFVPAFRVAATVLEKEAAIVSAGLDSEIDLDKYNRMAEALRGHLKFVASQKIPIKIDI